MIDGHLLAAAFIAANSPRACHCPAYQLTAFSNSAEPGHRRRLAVLDKRNAFITRVFLLTSAAGFMLRDISQCSI